MDTLTRPTRRQLITALATLPLLLAGCKDHGTTASVAAKGSGERVLKIGYQKAGSVNLLRLRGDLEKRLTPLGVKVEWVNFPSGPPMLEAIGTGSIHLGATGDAAAVFALAAGYPLVYVANTPPDDWTSRAILVPKDSPIKTVADLRGKIISVPKGSGTHNYLVQVLAQAGIPYDAVKIRYLAPAEGRAAFDAGVIDAWAIWDPFLAVAQESGNARTLSAGEKIVTAGGFYLSTKTFVDDNKDILKVVLEEIDKTAVWSWKHPHDSAVVLSPSLGVDVKTLERMQSRTKRGEHFVGFQPINDDIMKAQQEIADNFLKIGLLPKSVDVRAGLLTPKEYHDLLPAPEAKVAVAGGEGRH